VTQKNNLTISYADAGVNIDEGNALVEHIKPLAASTRRTGSMDGLGGFGGLFDLKACGYKDPIIVSCTDGVGTKLKLAFDANIHNTVGIDLVAMCVNDLVVQAAEPLFFLDYFACGALSSDHAAQVIAGIAEGCRQAGCQLIGGETAEMPGMYADGEYDLAGFSVGVAERSQLLPNKASLAAGDVVLGLASSGVHSNGFSLVRKLLNNLGLSIHDVAPFDPSKTLGEVLLVPTRIYIKSCLQLAQSGRIKALAHITGGGLVENLPRILPENLSVSLNLGSWSMPAIFNWIWGTGKIEQPELLRTFNCGIGMAVIVSASEAAAVTAELTQAGEQVFTIGHVEARSGGAVTLHGALA